MTSNTGRSGCPTPGIRYRTSMVGSIGSSQSSRTLPPGGGSASTSMSAGGFEPEEHLHALFRQVDFDSQELVAGVRGHGIAVAHDAATAAVPVVLLPENPVLRLLVLQLVQLLPKALLLPGDRPIAFVVE